MISSELICRGCYALGSACGQCRRCMEEADELQRDGKIDGALTVMEDMHKAAIEYYERTLRPKMHSVLQDWVMRLPLRYQGTLLTAVRGCDDEPKTWTRTGVAYSPGRRLTAFIRWCFMNPADPREADCEEGAFFQSKPPDPFKPSEFGHLPQHWYSHVMHALEIIGYCHPDEQTCKSARLLYLAMVKNLHLNPESYSQQMLRLTEDRIATGTVVS